MFGMSAASFSAFCATWIFFRYEKVESVESSLISHGEKLPNACRSSRRGVAILAQHHHTMKRILLPLLSIAAIETQTQETRQHR